MEASSPPCDGCDRRRQRRRGHKHTAAWSVAAAATAVLLFAAAALLAPRADAFMLSVPGRRVAGLKRSRADDSARCPQPTAGVHASR